MVALTKLNDHSTWPQNSTTNYHWYVKYSCCMSRLFSLWHSLLHYWQCDQRWGNSIEVTLSSHSSSHLIKTDGKSVSSLSFSIAALATVTDSESVNHHYFFVFCFFVVNFFLFVGSSHVTLFSARKWATSAIFFLPSYSSKYVLFNQCYFSVYMLQYNLLI